MSKWTEVTVGSLAKVVSGYAFKSGEFGSQGVPVLKIKNVRVGRLDLTEVDHVSDNYLSLPDRYHSQPGDILVSLTGSHLSQPNSVVGRVALHDKSVPRCLINQRVGKFVVNDESLCDPAFLYRALNSSEIMRAIAMLAHGAASQANVSPKQVESVRIKLPGISCQRRIASILGAYDDLIEVNRRRVAILEEMARGLFEEWFVRFRFPGHEQVPLIDTSDGLLPQGWQWRPFSSLADFMNGFAFKPSHFEAKGWPIIKIPELKNGISDKTPRNSGDEVPDRYRVETGDLLFSWSGTFAVSEWTGGRGLLNQHLFLVCPETGVERGFLKVALRWAIPLFDNQGVGATMKHIRRSALDHTKVPYPGDEKLLEQANALFGSTYELCTNIRCQNERLAASRDLLLPRLISGQLSVEGAERDLEAAA